MCNLGNQGNPLFKSQGSLSRGDDITRGKRKCLASCQHQTWRYALKTPSLLFNKSSKHVVLTSSVFVPPVVDHSETMLENNPSMVSLLGEATNLDSQKHVHVTKKTTELLAIFMYDIFFWMQFEGRNCHVFCTKLLCWRFVVWEHPIYFATGLFTVQRLLADIEVLNFSLLPLQNKIPRRCMHC